MTKLLLHNQSHFTLHRNIPTLHLSHLEARTFPEPRTSIIKPRLFAPNTVSLVYHISSQITIPTIIHIADDSHSNHVVLLSFAFPSEFWGLFTGFIAISMMKYPADSL
jgi:hypothetical protein